MAEEGSKDSEAPCSRRTGPKIYRRHYFEPKAVCKHCNAMLCGDASRDGTSLMKGLRLMKVYETGPGSRQQHAMSSSDLDQSVSDSEQQQSSSAHSEQQKKPAVSTCEQSEHQLARMIAFHGYPSSIVEDDQFRRFAEMLCPGFEMPSRGRVEEVSDAIFDEEMSSLRGLLHGAPGRVSLSLGTAHVENVRVVYLGAHFIDGSWSLHRRVIKVLKASDDGISGKILDVKDCHLKPTERCRFSCDVVKKAVSCWGLEDRVGATVSHTHGHDKQKDDLQAMQSLGATNMCSELVHVANSFIYHLNHATRQSWLNSFGESCSCMNKHREISSRLRLKHPWEYDWPWYTIYYALEVLHDECSSEAAEIARLAGEDVFQETDLTELYRVTLGIIYRAMEGISASSSPAINIALVELLKLREKLQSEYKDACGSKADTYKQLNSFFIRSAAGALEAANENLESFLERSYLPLSIPLVLDPRFKLKYVESFFKNASLRADYTCEVQEEVHRLFTEYKDQTDKENVDSPHQVHESTCETVDPSGEANPSSQEGKTELDAYLQDETVPVTQEKFDILKWWKGNCHRYPNVAKMARDFLAIPASTLPSSQQITEIVNHLRRYT